MFVQSVKNLIIKGKGVNYWNKLAYYRTLS